MKYINTIWEVFDYDVWGNREEGYEVNDRYGRGKIELRIQVKKYNVGTMYEFESATPSDRQLRKALDIKDKVEISTEGDDTHIYVNAEDDGYPCGELHCISHSSLSPVRKGEEK